MITGLKLRGLIFVFLSLALLRGAAYAGGFYCPRTGIYVEEARQSMADVESACGSPTTKESKKGRKGTVTERWTYDFGPTYFVRILIFVGGRLVAIEEGGYGQSH